MRRPEPAIAASLLTEHHDLSEKIIGCAFRVYNRLGFGFLESVYEKAMLLELRRSRMDAQSQKPITVWYGEDVVGEFVADLLVGDVIVELKSVQKLAQTHEIQVVNYLTATGKSVGLLVNFGPSGVEVRRKVRVLPTATSEDPVNPV